MSHEFRTPYLALLFWLAPSLPFFFFSIFNPSFFFFTHRDFPSTHQTQNNKIRHSFIFFVILISSSSLPFSVSLPYLFYQISPFSSHSSSQFFFSFLSSFRPLFPTHANVVSWF